MESLQLPFHDRFEAGQVLGAMLRADYADRPGVIVLALPRGGVPVGFEVARTLAAPLDVYVVRKLGVPGHEELAMGALAPGGIVVRNEQVLRALGISATTFRAVVERERHEVERRQHAYRGEAAPLEVAGRIAILVDDGLATGATMRAAISALRRMKPERLVVAVPVAAPSTRDELAAEVDELVCVRTPEPFHAVGFWYAVFEQTSDDEVRHLLGLAHTAPLPTPPT